MAVLKNRYSYVAPNIINGILYNKTQIVEDNTNWVVAQRDNISIAVASGILKVSTDNSATFPTTTAFTDANKIQQGWIHSNGTINLMTNDNKIYKTTASLTTVTECSIFESDGVTARVPHTPQNASYPGWYYNTTSHQQNGLKDDIHVFINYANAYDSGGTPMNIMYSIDYGDTYKVAYEFGQYSRYYDDGTASGGSTGTPTVLGNASSSFLIKHGHSIIYCPANGKWLCFTGDRIWTPLPAANEIHWFWLTYDDIGDSWSIEDIDFGFIPNTNSRLKTDDGFFVGNYLYYGSDYTAATDLGETGIFKVHIDDIATIGSHTQLIPLQNAADQIIDMCVDTNTGYVVATIAQGAYPYTNYSLLVAKNYGEGAHSFKYFNDKVFFRIHSINSNGFMRMDSNPTAFSALQGQTMFLKIGDNLFNDI